MSVPPHLLVGHLVLAGEAKVHFPLTGPWDLLRVPLEPTSLEVEEN